MRNYVTVPGAGGVAGAAGAGGVAGGAGGDESVLLALTQSGCRIPALGIVWVWNSHSTPAALCLPQDFSRNPPSG